MMLTCDTHGVFAVWIAPAQVDTTSATHVTTEHAVGPPPDITWVCEPDNPAEWPAKPVDVPDPAEKWPSQALTEQPTPEL
jgi:hypothetical protein